MNKKIKSMYLPPGELTVSIKPTHNTHYMVRVKSHKKEKSFAIPFVWILDVYTKRVNEYAAHSCAYIPDELSEIDFGYEKLLGDLNVEYFHGESTEKSILRAIVAPDLDYQKTCEIFMEVIDLTTLGELAEKTNINPELINTDTTPAKIINTTQPRANKTIIKAIEELSHKIKTQGGHINLTL